jgi:hypothetical protein
MRPPRLRRSVRMELPPGRTECEVDLAQDAECRLACTPAGRIDWPKVYYVSIRGLKPHKWILTDLTVMQRYRRCVVLSPPRPPDMNERLARGSRLAEQLPRRTA